MKCRSFGEKQRIAAVKCRSFGEKQRIAAIKCREVWRETKKRYDKGLVRCAGNIN